MTEDIKALDGVYNFSDAVRVVNEVLAIQEESAASILPAHSSPEVEAFWRGRQQMAAAFSMLFENENMIRHYLRKADAREDVREGLRQSAAGEVESLGSFEKYADEEV